MHTSLSNHTITIASSKPPPSASPWIAATEGFLASAHQMTQ